MKTMKFFFGVCLIVASGLLTSFSNITDQTTVDTQVDNTSAEWKSIAPDEVDVNAVKMFRNAMALAVGTKEEHNAMAIAWGGFGMLWGKPVITVYVSSSRHTYSLMEKNEYFTVSAFPESERGKVMFIGMHSGRDTKDKIADAGLTPEYTDNGNIRFKESNLCFECKMIYKEELCKDSIDNETAKFYDNGTGVHHMYVGEIVNVWKK